MLCERCWADAAMRTLANGRERMDNYRDLLKEREANPCTPEQQRGEEPAAAAEARRDG